MNEEESLKNWLKTAGLETPSERFTEKVMQKIEAEAAQSVLIESNLKALLQAHTLAHPSHDFTKKVMGKAVAPKVYAPIIPSKAWYAVAAVLVLFMVASIYTWKPSHSVAPQYSPSLPHFTLLSSIPFTYAAGLLVIGILFAIAHLLQYKTLKIN
ncbi:hypothetical protein [Runella zeae]|uniref:hypothetical protein n=1 Tax=Runella zeae TaxID=94255 RepID=UPI0003FABC48|nr:hypothetical protein [Runella zeae]